MLSNGLSPFHRRVNLPLLSGIYEIYTFIVWDSVWRVEHEDWRYCVNYYQETHLLNDIFGTPSYCCWWSLSDIFNENMQISETMTKIVCRCSDVKSDRYQYNNKSVMERACTRCDQMSEENVFHLIMQCASNLEMRKCMLDEVKDNLYAMYSALENKPHEMFKVLLGKTTEGFNFEEMCRLWMIAGKWIQRMYIATLRERHGIG